MYHWLMEHDPDENIKGDYNCKANGFGVYADRVIQGENMQMFLSFMLSSPMLQEWPQVQWFLQEIARKRNIDPELALKPIEQVIQERMDKMKLEMMAGAIAPPGKGGNGKGGEAIPAEGMV
jgi:hypothetical protein